jgi:hypothetical protein
MGNRLKFKRISHFAVYTLCLGVCIAHGAEIDDGQQALERSLQEFDEKILRELEEAQQARQENARQKAAMRDDNELQAEDESGDDQGQSENESEGREQGDSDGESQAAGTESEESGDEGNGSASETGQEQAGQASDGMSVEAGNVQLGQTAADGQEGESTSNTPLADIPSGDDDDVIARQLREAAEAETDPELKEKLWEEYRKYKNQRNPGP